MKVIIVGTGHNSEFARNVISRIEELGCEALVWDDMAPPTLNALDTMRSLGGSVFDNPTKIFPKSKSKFHN